MRPMTISGRSSKGAPFFAAHITSNFIKFLTFPAPFSTKIRQVALPLNSLAVFCFLKIGYNVSSYSNILSTTTLQRKLGRKKEGAHKGLTIP